MAREFFGQETSALDNGRLHLEYLTKTGPRIVRLSLAGSETNLLAELPNATLETPNGPYHLRGGHRLWHAPEANPRSYLSDDEGLPVEMVENGVRLSQPTEPGSGIAKSITITLAPGAASRVTLHHELRNEGPWTVELAPWAITQLAIGGVAILPQETGNLDASGLLPNRQLALWPYTRLGDPRLEMHNDYILIHALPNPAVPWPTPCKIGYFNRAGWVAYLNGGVLFKKSFMVFPQSPHVDFGCNAESYVCGEFIEVESVGPMAKLAPGESVSHIETWEITAGVEAPQSIEGVRELFSVYSGLRKCCTFVTACMAL